MRPLPAIRAYATLLFFIVLVGGAVLGSEQSQAERVSKDAPLPVTVATLS
jgi:hypothetical protein